MLKNRSFSSQLSGVCTVPPVKKVKIVKIVFLNFSVEIPLVGIMLMRGLCFGLASISFVYALK